MLKYEMASSCAGAECDRLVNTLLPAKGWSRIIRVPRLEATQASAYAPRATSQPGFTAKPEFSAPAVWSVAATAARQAMARRR
jgi:hypothetical protein